MDTVVDRFDDWKLSGGGMQADSYLHKNNPELILKLFSESVPFKVIEDEFRISDSLTEYGIPCPKAIRMVSFGKRNGIIYQRIINKKSFSRLAGEKPEMIPFLAKQLAELGRKLHSTSAENSPFPSQMKLFRQLIDENKKLDGKTLAIMDEAWHQILKDDSKTFIHGDFHFGNAITDGKSNYFIDLGSAAYGNPNFDISMFYFVTHYGSEEVTHLNYHMSVAQIESFWTEFKKNYYGRNIPDEELILILRPYLLFRILWIIRFVGEPPFVYKLLDIFLKEKPQTFDRTF